MQTRPSSRRLYLAAVALCTFAGATPQAGDGSANGLRFDSPGVLDLAERMQQMTDTEVPIAVLGAEPAEKILAAPTISELQPSLLFSDDLYGCKTTSTACSLEHERKLIDVAGGAVKRNGKRLSIAPTGGPALVFADWNSTATRTADGDEETHWYLGRLPGNGYYRVEVQFGHDAPGSFLINPANGKTAFVHNGSDVVAAAPDGRRLVTFNTLNPPLSIRVAALDDTGPRVQLQCEVGKDVDHIDAMFKGWHDAGSFDLAIEIRNARSKLAHRVALRIAQDPAGWSIATPVKAQLDAIGFTCRVPKSN